MFISIFTDELWQDLPQALPIYQSWGMTHVDLRGRIFGKGVESLSDDELQQVKRLLADHGLQLGALQTSLAKVHLPEADRQKAEAQKLEGIIRAADALDCRLVRSFNFWQPPIQSQGDLAVQPDQMQRVLEMFAPIAKRAKAAGLTLAFEDCGQTPDEVLALLDALNEPTWGLAWDCHNGWNSPQRERDEVEWIVRLAQRSKMVHVKAASIVPELGGTVLPWDRILATLAAAGLTGPVSIETHNPKDSPIGHLEASKRSYDLIKQAWPSAAPGDIREAARATSVPTVQRSYADKPVGFVVVGLGMGHNRSNGITKVPGAKLLGVCDVREDRAKRSGEAYNVPYTTDVAPWLKDPNVEVVFVVTPTGRHAEVALQAIDAGKHVISTKPMEANLAACDAMIQAAERKGVILAVDLEMRHKLPLQQFQAAAKAGFFGKILSATCALKIRRTMEYFQENGAWRGTWRYDGGGTLSNQAIHHIDELVAILGVPRKVKGEIFTQDHDIEAEDLGSGLWMYDNGAVVQFYSTTCFPHNTWYHRLEIHGTQGACVTASGGPEANCQHWFSTADNKWSDKAPVTVTPPWINTADNVAAAIRTGAELLSPGREGRKSRLVLDAMYKSAKSGGGWVELSSMRKVEDPLPAKPELALAGV